ncbi:accessory gene regulator ArgB-like protein [Alkalicoccobacillus gibsonii]|uniref:accessory gene regulator ArgB-like protein n=1 Tax=Alkalicoccobacillus gibsonii TaxID=79881 RepID=UPI003519C312
MKGTIKMITPFAVSNQLTEYVVKQVPEYKVRKDTIRYGLEWTISIVIQITLVTIIASLLGILSEALITLLTGAVLRAFGGGAHFKSYTKCVMYSSFIILFISILAGSFLFLNFIHITLIYIYAMYIYILKAPVLHKTKILFNERKKLKFKVISLIFLTVLFLLTILIVESSRSNHSLITCLWISVLFQSVSLTNVHHSITDWLDIKTTKKGVY